MKKEFVLYLSGGTMRGVFGAGVATYLDESGICEQLTAVYGSSAGAVTAAYLLTRQTRTGSSIFYVDLIHDFISVRSFLGGMKDRITRYVLGKDMQGVRDAINLDILFDAVKNKKILDLAKLRSSKVPLWIKVLNLQTAQSEYLLMHKHDPLALLRASTSTIPYVHTPVYLKEIPYGDAATVDQINISELRRRHPSAKIVIVFSSDMYFKRGNVVKNCIEGMFAYMMYGAPYYKLFATAPQRLEEDMRLIKSDKNILLVAPPKNDPTLTRTRNPKKLKITYVMGLEAGEKIKDFIFL